MQSCAQQFGRRRDARADRLHVNWNINTFSLRSQHLAVPDNVDPTCNVVNYYMRNIYVFLFLPDQSPAIGTITANCNS